MRMGSLCFVGGFRSLCLWLRFFPVSFTERKVDRQFGRLSRNQSDGSFFLDLVIMISMVVELSLYRVLESNHILWYL